ncbi:tafazzin, phospholipid-lysophospholipid transacylase isoform X5 [Tachypleus tridentatus]|uniref:tafazzin, phospholipid-lysophospholipid transacylase isoform X5 n=1 Tax=Tachypleus tridentatus TaxID=6853 RepID=UPI003FD51E89
MFRILSLMEKRDFIHKMPLELQWPFPDFSKPHRLWQIRSSFVVCAVGMWSKIMTGILDWHHLMNPKVMRWSAAAHDICFTSKWHSTFFAHGKTFPLCRGEGVYQWAMDFCVTLANAGNWIHFFPEGKVNLMTKEFHRLKWGVGRLITETKICPLVIPFWHIGMDEVLPSKKPYFPRIGKGVTVLIGDPVNFKSVREKLKKEKQTVMVQRKLVTDILQEELGRLKQQAEQLHHLTFCLR